MHKPLLALAAALLATAANADTLINNLNGIQVDANGKLEHFTGILIGNDGKVKHVLHGEMFKLRDTDVVDAQGRTVLPGLIDAHGHVLDLGTTQMTVQLVATSSLADLQKRLSDYAAAHPRDAWIIGFGWNQE
jgi:predicted amidohydrolase YtcJ